VGTPDAPRAVHGDLAFAAGHLFAAVNPAFLENAECEFNALLINA
jgi:hypothetical protein